MKAELVDLEPSGKLPRLVEALRRNAGTAGEPLHEQRERFEALAATMVVCQGVTCQPVTAEGVGAEWLIPVGETGRTILYFHGGGYAVGSLNTIRPLASHLAVATGHRVLTVDYRLAPEHPCPAAVDDSVAVWAWLLRQGTDPQALVFGGDSAGGGLAIAAMVAARVQGLPLPAGAVCLSPWADLTLSARSIDRNADNDPEATRQNLAKVAGHYLGGADPATPLASPVFADLTGLPPLLIQAGTAETLLDDAHLLADVATRAGVDVTLELYPDMIHVWHAFAPGLPEATTALARIARWLATPSQDTKAPTSSVGEKHSQVLEP